MLADAQCSSYFRIASGSLFDERLHCDAKQPLHPRPEQRRNPALMLPASRWLFLSQDHGLVESRNARPGLFPRPGAGEVAQPVTELDCASKCLPAGELEMPSVVEAHSRGHLRR